MSNSTIAGIRAVLFDVDDTLVDTAGAFYQALAAVAQQYLPQGIAVPEVLSHWRQDPGGFYAAYERGDLEYAAQRRLRAELVQTTFGGAALDDASFARWNELFEATFVAGWVAIAGASELVQALVEAGLPVGALSNAGVKYQTRKLAAAGLAGVPMLVGVDTLGFGKPDPRVFHEAVTRLGQLAGLSGLAAHEVAYVGDNPINDAQAAAAAGLVPIWFTPVDACDSEPTGASFEGLRVTTLCEVAKLVIPADQSA